MYFYPSQGTKHVALLIETMTIFVFDTTTFIGIKISQCNWMKSFKMLRTIHTFLS
jgi:hypothetical protein